MDAYTKRGDRLKIPKWIEKSIRQCAYHEAIAARENAKIRDWLKENNMANDTVFDVLIDSAEQTNNPQDFIDFLTGFDNKDSKNSPDY